MVWQDEDCAVISAARPSTIAGGTIEATEMCFAATDDNVATLLHNFCLMAGFPQSSVQLTRKTGPAATVQFADLLLKPTFFSGF